MLIFASTLALHGGEASKPLPLRPGSRFTVQDRDRAVERGVKFLYQIASNPDAFARWGHDLIWCFYSFSTTSKNPNLRDTARGMGQERALQWRRDHPAAPQDNPIDLSNFVFGDIAATGLGVPNGSLREQVTLAAGHFSAVDFIGFDPAREPPPADLPEDCPKCGQHNRRGVTRCVRCGAALHFKDRYEVWLDALILTYRGDVYGVKLGASYDDVLRWIHGMRPYPSPRKLGFDETFYTTYAITHVVYTLNDYSRCRLSPSWLPEEYKYLKRNLKAAVSEDDPEMLGEFMDTLRAFGVSEEDASMRKAIAYELSHQNADGSWGNTAAESLYDRYHATWTAVDGLREYSFGSRQLRRPELLSIVDPHRKASR